MPEGQSRKIFPLLRQKLLDRGCLSISNLRRARSRDSPLPPGHGEGYNYLISCGETGLITRPSKPWWAAGLSWVLSRGNRNDFPANLGIPEDLDSACDLLLKGRIRKIDVIQVNNGEYMAGVGASGLIRRSMPSPIESVVSWGRTLMFCPC